MKIAVASSLFSRYCLERTFEAASRLGYDGIELWGGRPHAYAPDMDDIAVERICALREKYHLKIPMYAPELIRYPYNLCSADERERQQTTSLLQSCVHVAQKIGAPRLRVCCGHTQYFTTRKQNMENLRRALEPVVELAEKMQIYLVLAPLAPMQSDVLCLADELAEMIARMDSPYVQGMLDTIVPLICWEPYYPYFEKIRRLDYIHLSDGNGKTQERLPIGTGVIDIPAFLETLRRYRFDGWLTILLEENYMRDPELFAGGELRKLKKLLHESVSR